MIPDRFIELIDTITERYASDVPSAPNIAAYDQKLAQSRQLTSRVIQAFKVTRKHLTEDQAVVLMVQILSEFSEDVRWSVLLVLLLDQIQETTSAEDIG